jgi:outer membrane cobalamin receptor
MRPLILFVTGLALTTGVSFADIRGTVNDPSGRPIEGARVECGSKTAYTNIEGLFAIPDIQDCAARITKAGFKTATSTLTAGAEAKLTLAVEGPFESVIVTATRSETTPEQAGVAASVLTAHDFDVRDNPTVADVLREIPGVQVTNYSRRGGLTQLFTRGAERTGTLVLVDGVPLNDPGGELHMEHITSTGIDRVEIVRGPESALFGAEAAAGVVQLFTKRGDPEDKQPHLTASYERGNFGTDRWTAGISGGSGEKFDYALSAEQLHTAGEFQNDFYRDTTGTANLGYRFSAATQLRGVFRMYDAHVGTPDQVGYGVLDTDGNEETRNVSTTVTLDDTRGAHYFQHFWFGYNHLSDRFNDSITESYDIAALLRDVPGPQPRTYFVTLLKPPFPTQAPPGLRLVTTTDTLYAFPSLNLTQRETAGYQGTYTQSGGGALVFGYEYQHQAGTISDLDVSREHSGFFINEQKTIGKRIFVSGGFRVEHSSAFGTQFVPRGSASFLLFGEHGGLSSTYLRFSAGRGITDPSLLENFAQSPFFHGNPGLKPETTKSYEVGIVQEWFGRRLHTEVSAFRSSFTNLIAFLNSTWENVQASWARGVEASAGLRLPANVRFDATYMRLYTRIVSSTSPTSSITGIGDELVHRPRNSGALTVSWTPRRWSVIVGARFVGERQDADFTFGANRNPGFENVYLSGSYEWTKHVSPVVRIDNLLDERYEEVLGYTALSRSVLGGIRVRW